MLIFQLMDTFNTFFNTIVRELSPVLKGFIAICFFTLAMFCLAKSIIKKDKNFPLKIGKFILFLIFLGIAILYTVN